MPLPSEQPRDVVQAYLAYLQEMSRKISQRTGMENVLYGKPKTQPHYYRALGTEDSPYFRSVAEYLAKDSDRQLFLANGLVVGCLQKRQTRKYIAAPLIYCLVKVETDDQREYEHTIEWDTISLNYDLITLLLEQDRTAEEDDTDEFSEQGIKVDTEVDSEKLDILEDMETTLQTLVEQGPIQIENYLLEVFNTLKRKFSECSLIELVAEDFKTECLQKKSMETGLKFYRHQCFYVANLPGQLSTYTALRKLIEEVS